MGEALMLYLNILSVLVSLALLILSFKWPGFGRFLFMLLFLWAAIINTKTSILDPEDYLNFASFAWFGFYRDFINGFFASNTTVVVLIIAFFQLLIAIFLVTKGKFVKWAGWGAIVFLIAIAPLGVGSGFPSTLIMAAAIFLIIRKSSDRNVLEIFRDQLSNLMPKN